MATAIEGAAPAVAGAVEVPVVPEKVEEVREDGAGEAKTEEEMPVAAEKKLDELKDSAAGEAKTDEGEAKAVDGEAEKKAEGEPEEKEKKARKPRARKPKSAAPHHPPYFEMIKEAILALDGNGKAGSSPYAIAKHMGEQHRDVLPANYRKVLAVQLRNFAAKGRLVKVKASFKLAAAEEKKAAMASRKRKRTPAAGKKEAAPKEAKKAAPARPARAKRTKKAAPAMPKPKQPRSIRAGVARKANKASA